MLEDFFNKEYFENFFTSHLSFKNGGGKDKIKPSVYWRVYRKEVDKIIEKCLSGEYEFSIYNEYLVSKGSKSYPRVISIPIVRDRWVLGVLNQYLSELFPECVNHHTPNAYIKDVQTYLEGHKGEGINFFKSDFTKFYNNISQTVLLDKLSKRIDNPNIYLLIKKAIQTPTYPGPKAKTDLNKAGVPQGLAISNILASIYMYDFDSYINSKVKGLYIRYVDDILILSKEKESWLDIMKEYSDRESLELNHSSEKTTEGLLNTTSVDYIGYIISVDKITPREKNVDSFLNRIASKCTKFKNLYNNKSLRPLFIEKDDDLISYYVDSLNMMISGIKIENRLYGWMPYFQAINDISLLYRIDKIIKTKLLKGLDDTIVSQIHSIVKTYYAILERDGHGFITDFDSIESPRQKKNYLAKRGLIFLSKTYTDDQIEAIFSSHKEKIKRNTQKNIGYSN